jgi:carbamoyl-phosphate synthase small subunit
MKYQTLEKSSLLADGAIFFIGKSVGMKAHHPEICFNTGMTGYQEIFTDPSCLVQLLGGYKCSHIGKLWNQ